MEKKQFMLLFGDAFQIEEYFGSWMFSDLLG